MTPTSRLVGTLLLCAAAAPAQIDPAEWKTDVSKRSIDLSELYRSVPRDQFITVDRPTFAAPAEAASWLAAEEPVIVVELEGVARAYPIQILLYHELVNDGIGSTLLLISYCPLCNSGVVFDRRVEGRELSFGVAGFLRKSDMVMYDRETETLWQQFTGEGLVGELYGKRLEVVRSRIVPFGDFATAFPEGQVLERMAGMPAPYGESHYVDYEWGAKRNMTPVRLKRPLATAPLERVVAFSIEGESKAYTFDYLRRRNVVEGKIKKTRYVILFTPTTLSAMDAKKISESRAVGSAGVFSPMLDGERLRFRAKKGKIYDKKTGSRWNVLGYAVDGPLAGRRLAPLDHAEAFAFAWFAFYPETRLIGGRALFEEPGFGGRP